MISQGDINDAANKEKKQLWATDKAETEYDVAQRIMYLLDGFDAENNAIDRRIYYEVTGKKINEDEFIGGDTSDDEWGTRN